MTEDVFLSFGNGVQAMRRRTEALGLKMCGALGVAAEPYPYQLSTVRQILSDVRIRHLISDEVGMGKTVQALMILNALRYRNPSHKTIILAPPRLLHQWHEECWTRAHVRASVFDSDDDSDESLVRIVNPQDIQSQSDEDDTGSRKFQLKPNEFDLLIVDEPQLMPVEVMQAALRVSADFRQLLLLSASPGLGDPARRDRILSILEPERAYIANQSDQTIDDYLDEIEETARLEIGEGRADAGNAFKTSSKARRIVRSTRDDWSRYFPDRRYNRVRTDPIDSDIDRLRHGLEWLEQDTGDRDYWTRSQVLHRGARSVRQLLSSADLINSPAGTKALENCGKGPGDGRLDALFDLLSEIWSAHREEKVVIVAGDNPTIDFVSRRISRYFEADGFSPGISSLRRLAGTAGSAVDDIRQIQEELADFARGSDRILFVGDWIQAGLNLHYFARNIIFYNTPWDHAAVDQLIGRLDRLRPNGLYKGDSQKHLGHIRIWSITQPESPEERVVDGLEKLGVFHRPFPPIPPEMSQLIAQNLENLARQESPSASLRELERIGQELRQSTKLSVLENPYAVSVEQSLHFYHALQRAELPEPVINFFEPSSFTQKCESAFMGWLELLRGSGLFEIRGRADRGDDSIRFRTIWYTDANKRNPPIRLDELAARNWMSGHAPFICALRDLGRPPLKTVFTDEGEPDGRPLRFLDHGDSLHDTLVAQSINHAHSVAKSGISRGRIIRFDPENPALENLSGKTMMICATYADPAMVGLPLQLFEEFRSDADSLISTASTQAQKDRLARLLALAREWWDADARWLNLRIGPFFEVSSCQQNVGGWKAVERSDLYELLRADAGRRGARSPRAYGPEISISETVAQKGVGALLDGQQHRLTSNWRTSIEEVEGELEDRIVVIRSEQNDLMQTFRIREKAAEERTNVDDEDQRRMMEGQLAGERKMMELAELANKTRLAWLTQIPERLRNAQAEILGAVLLRPVPFQD